MEGLVDALGQAAPTVLGALIALAGTILLFLLQQRAQRRAKRQEELTDAIEHLMETLVAVRDVAAASSKSRAEEATQRMFVRSWRFAWLLTKRERPVADWAWQEVYRALQTPRRNGERERALRLLIPRVMTGLNDWRTGNKKVRWFREEAARLSQTLVARPR